MLILKNGMIIINEITYMCMFNTLTLKLNQQVNKRRVFYTTEKILITKKNACVNFKLQKHSRICELMDLYLV